LREGALRLLAPRSDDRINGQDRLDLRSSGRQAQEILATAAQQLGVTVTAASTGLAAPAMKLHPVRIALWDQYGGSVSSGWIRWLLERYEFPFERVYANH
jgi:hypothetical protein